MQQTPLHDWHVANKACMVDFHGWHMPLYYKGITEEHLHTRNHAGLFDLGHMGRVFIKGTGARDFINHLTPARVASAKAGEVQYSFLLRENGTTIDDITIYYEPDAILLVINAGNCERDIAWIKEQAAAHPDVTIEDYSDSWAMVAIQGPESKRVIQALFGNDFDLPYYQFRRLSDTIAPGELIISCTGYTGENGYEIYLPAEHALKVWEALIGIDPGVEVWPIGLGARDSLRLEAAMPLYGHELNDDTTPLQAGLGKFVDLEKGPFIGRDALTEIKKAGGAATKLVAFEMKQRGPIARQGFALYASDGTQIGEIASGIFSPTLQKVIGTAYVQSASATVGSEIQIDVRGRMHPAVLVKRPFYKRSA